MITRYMLVKLFFFSSRRRHTIFDCDWSSDVCSSDLAAALPRLPHGRDGLPRTVRDGEEPEIGGGDLALPRDTVFQPLHETGPVLRSGQDHGEVAHLPGLNQRERLEQLVHRPVSSRVHEEPGQVLDEHRLADEEVTEVDGAFDVGVEPLLERQLDVATDGQAVSLLAPRFAASMIPGPPPVMIGNPSCASMRPVSTALS